MKPSEAIYLDYAAATPVADHVLTAMMPYFSERFYNPSSPYLPAVQVRREYEAAKQRLAETFGAKGDEIIMTAGATESINLAFAHIKSHVVSSDIEHKSVLAAVRQYDHTLVRPTAQGIVDPDTIAKAITPDTEMVTISLANSEIGTIQPIRKIATIVDHERQNRMKNGNKHPILLHCDASQGVGQLDIHVSRLGIDLLTLNAAKMYGPKQVGLLWAKSSVALAPTILGGGQERGLRSGTENVAGVIGFSEAASWASRHHAEESKRLRELRDVFESRILAELPNAVVIGSKKHRLSGHSSIAFPNIDAERIIFLLEEKHIYVATGSACSANSATASHVLKALAVDDVLVNGNLRITLGKYTTKLAIERAAICIIEAVKSEYARMKSV